MTALVPPVPRWIITTFLSGRYRRAAYRLWRLPEHSGRKAPMSGQAEMMTTAAPGTVWAVLADVTRVGEWSHECHGAVWLDGAAAAAVGARFRGHHDRLAALRADLGRLAAIAEAQPARPHQRQPSVSESCLRAARSTGLACGHEWPGLRGNRRNVGDRQGHRGRAGERGAQLVLVSRDRGGGEAVAAELATAGGPAPRLEVADLSSMAQVRALAARLSALDRIDGSSARS